MKIIFSHANVAFVTIPSERASIAQVLDRGTHTMMRAAVPNAIVAFALIVIPTMLEELSREGWPQTAQFFIAIGNLLALATASGAIAFATSGGGSGTRISPSAAFGAGFRFSARVFKLYFSLMPALVLAFAVLAVPGAIWLFTWRTSSNGFVRIVSEIACLGPSALLFVIAVASVTGAFNIAVVAIVSAGSSVREARAATLGKLLRKPERRRGIIVTLCAYSPYAIAVALSIVMAALHVETFLRITVDAIVRAIAFAVSIAIAVAYYEDLRRHFEGIDFHRAIPS